MRKIAFLFFGIIFVVFTMSCSSNRGYQSVNVRDYPEVVTSSADIEQVLEKTLLSLVDVNKAVSVPPQGTVNQVDDLVVSDIGNGNFRASWSYKNIGDYNQDSTVNISDISSVAEKFFSKEREDYAYSYVVDGNNDGVINISDISPLAEHFFSNLDYYSISGSSSVTGEFIELAKIDFSQSISAGHKRWKTFETIVNSQGKTYFQVLPYFNGIAGAASEVVNVLPKPTQEQDWMNQQWWGYEIFIGDRPGEEVYYPFTLYFSNSRFTAFTDNDNFTIQYDIRMEFYDYQPPPPDPFRFNGPDPDLTYPLIGSGRYGREQGFERFGMELEDITGVNIVFSSVLVFSYDTPPSVTGWLDKTLANGDMVGGSAGFLLDSAI